MHHVDSFGELSQTK